MADIITDSDSFLLPHLLFHRLLLKVFLLLKNLNDALLDAIRTELMVFHQFLWHFV